MHNAALFLFSLPPCLVLPQSFLSCLCSCCCDKDDNRQGKLKGHIDFTPSLLSLSLYLANVAAYITQGSYTLYLLLQRDKDDESEKRM